MASNKSINIINKELKFNPALTPNLLSSLTSLSERTIRPAISDYPSFSIPLLNNGPNNIVHLPKQKHTLLHPYAIGMNFHRSMITRQFLSQDEVSSRIHWAFSPYMFSESGFLFDALVCVKGKKRNGRLALLLSGYRHNFPPEYFVEAIEHWAKERTKGIFIDTPMDLVIFSYPFANGQIEKMIKGKQLPFSKINLLSFDDAGQYFSAESIEKKEQLPLSYMERAQYQKRSFWRKKENITHWIDDEKAGDDNILAAATHSMCKLSKPEMMVLSIYAKFPGFSGLDIQHFFEYLKIPVSTARNIRQIINMLVKEQLLESISNKFEDEMILTEKGEHVIGFIYGLNNSPSHTQIFFPKISSLAYHKKFANHQHQVKEVVKQFYLNFPLAQWLFMNTKTRFSEITVGNFSPPLRPITIEPDSILYLNLKNSPRGIWLEIDRGSKKGEKIENQLKKYVLSYFSQESIRMPGLILYVVSDNHCADTRIDYLKNKLLRLLDNSNIVRYRTPPSHLFGFINYDDILNANTPIEFYKLPVQLIWRENNNPENFQENELLAGVLDRIATPK